MGSVADLVIEPAGHLPWLWGTVFVLGNLIAAFWMVKAALAALPSISYRLKKATSSLKLGKATAGSSSRCSSISSLATANDSIAVVADRAAVGDCVRAMPQLQSVRFEWRGMGCSVKTATGTKDILKGVWGCAQPRQLHGLLGPSGAGKSTLLDLLTLRMPSSNASSGQLLTNGAPVSQKQLMGLSVYVPQKDSLVPVLTARESVEFAAAMKMPRGSPPELVKSRVSQVLALMGLAEQQEMLVGGPLPGGLVLPGMSGSERKQLHIACGVVAGASLVFLDEPTSGLDSCSALNIMMFLKAMATEEGATLLASVHQPRAVIWTQLDQVTLLASGRLMYTGPTDGLVPWFNSLGYPYNPEVQGVISDWALDLVSLGFEKHSHASTQQLLHLQHSSAAGAASKAKAAAAAAAAAAATFELSKQDDTKSVDIKTREVRSRTSSSSGSASSSKDAVGIIDSTHDDDLAPDLAHGKELITTQEELTAAADAFKQHLQRTSPELFGATSTGPVGSGSSCVAAELADVPTGASAFGKYKALLWRELLVTTRNPLDVGGRMLTFTYLGLMWGLVSFNLPGDAGSIYERMLVCYVTVAFYLLLPYVSMSLFSGDKGLFAADVAGRLYHPVQYYLSKLSVSLPLNALLSAVFQLVYYGMAGMRHGAVYMARSCVISTLMGLIGMQAIYCCAMLASSQDLAFVLAIAWTCPNMFVCPYMLPFEKYSLGWGLSWLRYLTPANFAWQALTQLELSDRGFDCSEGSGLESLGLVPALLPNSTAQLRAIKERVNNLGKGCIASGNAVLDMYTEHLPFVASVFILLGYFFLLLVATYLGVKLTSKRMKH